MQNVSILGVEELKPQTANQLYRKIITKTAFNKEKIRKGANWTAYNREHLASIPSKNEYLIIENNTEKNRGFSSQVPRFKQIGNNHETPGPGAYKSESYSSIAKNTSFRNNSAFNNSKGFGNGFISNTERFNYLDEYKAGYCPGPGDYNNLNNPISNQHNTIKNIYAKQLCDISIGNKHTNHTETSEKSFVKYNANNNNHILNNDIISNKEVFLNHKFNLPIEVKELNLKEKGSIKLNKLKPKKIQPSEINNLNIKGYSISKTTKNLNSFLKKPVQQNLVYDLSNYNKSKAKVYINFHKCNVKRFEINKEILMKPGPTKYFLKPEDYKSNYNKIITNADTLDYQELKSCNSTVNDFYRTKSTFQRKTISDFNSNVTRADSKYTTNSLFHNTIINDLENKEKSEELLLKTFMFKKIKYNAGKTAVNYNNIERYKPKEFFNIRREFDQYLDIQNLEPQSSFMSKTQRLLSVNKAKLPGPAFYSPEKNTGKTTFNSNLGNWIC